MEEASKSRQQQGKSTMVASRQIRQQIRWVWLDFELGFLMVWFDFLLIFGQFCGGLSTVEMGCRGGGWVVLGWWLGVSPPLLLFFFCQIAMSFGMLCFFRWVGEW